MKTCCSSLDPAIDDTRSNLGPCNNNQTLKLPIMKKRSNFVVIILNQSHFGTIELMIIIGVTLYVFKDNIFSCICILYSFHRHQAL